MNSIFIIHLSKGGAKSEATVKLSDRKAENKKNKK